MEDRLKNSLGDRIRTAWCAYDTVVEPPVLWDNWWMCESRWPAPRQGWKLHISADVLCAHEVLDLCLPILFQSNTVFKVTRSLRILEQLNAGVWPSQVGKFITVYPASDAQAVLLAVSLHYATRGLGGPPVPTDRSLAPESLVYYRFGAFSGTVVTLSSGEITSALIAPDGQEVMDHRSERYWAPDWVTDPFAGVDLRAPRPTLLRPTVLSAAGESPPLSLGPELEARRRDPLRIQRRSREMTQGESTRLSERIREHCRPDRARSMVFLCGFPALGALVSLLIIALLGQPISPSPTFWWMLVSGALEGLLSGAHEVYLDGISRREAIARWERDRIVGEVDIISCVVELAAAVRSRPRTPSEPALDLLLDVGGRQLLYLKGRHLNRAGGRDAPPAGRT